MGWGAICGPEAEMNVIMPVKFVIFIENFI